MKGKKLTRNMKEYLSKNMRLDPTEWLYIKNTNTEFVIKNRFTEKEKVIDKVERNITRF